MVWPGPWLFYTPCVWAKGRGGLWQGRGAEEGWGEEVPCGWMHGVSSGSNIMLRVVSNHV